VYVLISDLKVHIAHVFTGILQEIPYHNLSVAIPLISGQQIWFDTWLQIPIPYRQPAYEAVEFVSLHFHYRMIFLFEKKMTKFPYTPSRDANIRFVCKQVSAVAVAIEYVMSVIVVVVIVMSVPNAGPKDLVVQPTIHPIVLKIILI